MTRTPTRRLSRHAILAVAIAFALPAPGALAGPDDAEGPSLTVYSSADPAGFDPQQFVAQQRAGRSPTSVWQVPGFGVVKEIRTLNLSKGANEVRFTDVAQFIDPTTVSFADLTTPAGTAVLEQAFQFDLVSPDKILARYVDQEIGYEVMKDGVAVASLKGKVLSVNEGQIVLQGADGGLRFIEAKDPGIRLPSLPKGLITRPTLVWKVESEAAGEHRVRTTYQTAGLTWRADYTVVLDGTDTKADVSAWMTLLNLSGAAYPNARLKLIAGDVQKVQRGGLAPPSASPAKEAGKPGGFEEKTFFEYHLYSLPRRTDVLQNTTQQITLFPTASGVGVEKLLVYYGAPWAAGYGGSPRTDRDLRTQANTKLDVYVRFKNAKENRMGMPLPKGKVRVYKQDDADGTLEFVGEDLIDHTPKDETVLVKLGQAFDVVGNRTQTDFSIDESRRTMTDTYRITLRNHKDAPVKVLVKENLFRWTTWSIEASSDPFTKADARTIHFEVEVPGNGEKDVTYTVRYAW